MFRGAGIALSDPGFLLTFTGEKNSRRNVLWECREREIWYGAVKGLGVNSAAGGYPTLQSCTAPYCFNLMLIFFVF